MDAGLVVGIVVLLLLLMLASEYPVALSLLVSGTVGLILLRGFDIAGPAVARVSYSTSATYTLVVIPMFIMMGAVAKNTEVAEKTYRLAARFLYKLPGGLAFASLMACAGFAAISGSSIATVVTVGRVSVDEMRRNGYELKFAAGVVGAAGTLGVLIPPSIAMVIYGILTGESVGQLLIAGIIPGLISAAMYGLNIYVRARRHPEWVGRGAADAPLDVAADTDLPGRSASIAIGVADSLRDERDLRNAQTDNDSEDVYSIRKNFDGLVKIVILFAVVVGGIYSGVFTVMEAAAMGAFAATLILVLGYLGRPREMLSRARASLVETVGLTGMIFFLIIGATVFTRFLVTARVPQAFTGWVLELNVPPMVIVLLLLLAFLPMGMFLDPMSILLIGVPIAYPVVSDLGFDGIWFGVLVIKMIELGMITPPVGLNAFVLSGTIDDLSSEDAFRAVGAYVPYDFLTIALIVAFPQLVTWLPRALGV